MCISRFHIVVLITILTRHLLIGASIILTQHDLELCALGVTELLFRTFQAELPDIPTWRQEWNCRSLLIISPIINLWISLSHHKPFRDVWGVIQLRLGAGQESIRPCPACSWPAARLPWQLHGTRVASEWPAAGRSMTSFNMPISGGTNVSKRDN